MDMSASKTISVDEFPPMKNPELPISKSTAELPPSPSTKPPPRPSLEPRMTSELALSESPNSPSARLNREPSPSKSHRSPTVRYASELVRNTRLSKRNSRFSSRRLSRTTCIPHGKNPWRKSKYFTRPSTEQLVQSESQLVHAKSSPRETSQCTHEMIERSKAHWSELEPLKAHWSELSEPGVLDEKIRSWNVEAFAILKQRYGEFFKDNLDDIGLIYLGEKIGKGGQADIYSARLLDHKDEVVLKVFLQSQNLKRLSSQIPMELLLKEARAYKEGKANPRLCHIFGGVLLDDGRFAFAMERYWGDLRKLIDMRMMRNGKGVPPFSMVVAKRIMMEIAEGMQGLHDYDVVHRDVKASNIFIKPLDQPYWFHPEEDAFSCVVGDFETNSFVVGDYETSIGVVGTGFWRAPEILHAYNTKSLEVELFTKKIDVYGFSMTCYEILTGLIPFEDRHPKDYVLSEIRPPIPSNIHPAMKSLLSKCWQHEPSARPTFVEILEELKNMIMVE